MRLDHAAARAVSPLFWNAPGRGSLDAVVGENESAEFFRQSKTIVDCWARLASRHDRHNSRRQSFHGDRSAGRSELADGGALKGIGGALRHPSIR